MLIQQLFMNIVGVKCITVLCSDGKYSGVAATTTHCRPTVPYRGNGETNVHTPVCMPYVVAENWSNRPFTFSGEGPRWRNSVCLLRERFGGTLESFHHLQHKCVWTCGCDWSVCNDLLMVIWTWENNKSLKCSFQIWLNWLNCYGVKLSRKRNFFLPLILGPPPQG